MAQEYRQITITEPKPFVKWVGGKRQLMQVLEDNFPKQFGTYHEPFLGGGAVMFNLLSKEPKLSCNVSDFNSDLILAYVTIRDKLGKLIESEREIIYGRFTFCHTSSIKVLKNF